MPTDSTELTFVRCPSCRSLVPAMSTRCRMCGATLDAAEKNGATPPDGDKQSRVRQRTMSESTPQGREESPPARAPANPPGAALQEDDLFDDPLKDFLEEVEEKSGPAKEETQAKPPKESEEPSIGISFAKKTADQPPSPESSESARPSQAQKPKFTFQGEEEEDSEIELEVKQPPIAAKPKSEPKAVRENPQSGKASKEENNGERQESSRSSHSQSMRPPQQEERRRDKQPPQSPPPAAKKGRSASPTEGAKKKQAAFQGRLFGWFVSYADQDGSSIEIREGKFFITREPLKPTDMVIDHESLSTPHAVVLADLEGGLQVQDLMSDGGIFVKRRGEAEFVKEEDRINVAHGDWVRFGDIEFLVALVAHVGEK